MNIDAWKVAKQYYNEKTYQHCIRVAGFAKMNKMCPLVPKYFYELETVGLLHDLYEDTDFPHILTGEEAVAINILTHDKKYSYPYYLKNIRELAENECLTDHIAAHLAYWVKIADMKDHLTQTETLTPKLKEKYLEGLAILL